MNYCTKLARDLWGTNRSKDWSFGVYRVILELIEPIDGEVMC